MVKSVLISSTVPRKNCEKLKNQAEIELKFAAVRLRERASLYLLSKACVNPKSTLIRAIKKGVSDSSSKKVKGSSPKKVLMIKLVYDRV